MGINLEAGGDFAQRYSSRWAFASKFLTGAGRTHFLIPAIQGVIILNVGFAKSEMLCCASYAVLFLGSLASGKTCTHLSDPRCLYLDEMQGVRQPVFLLLGVLSEGVFRLGPGVFSTYAVVACHRVCLEVWRLEGRSGHGVSSGHPGVDFLLSVRCS